MTSTTPGGRPRRPRGTPEQAEADITAAIDRLASQWGNGAAATLTATRLAEEAGMSRKQLYTYFAARPHLADQWSETVAKAKAARVASPGTVPAAEVAGLRRRVRELEQALDDWRCVAVATRAEAERQAQLVDQLRDDNARLRGTSDKAVTLRAVNPERS